MSTLDSPCVAFFARIQIFVGPCDCRHVARSRSARVLLVGVVVAVDADSYVTSSALVVENMTGTTVAPADDPGWNFVTDHGSQTTSILATAGCSRRSTSGCPRRREMRTSILRRFVQHDSEPGVHREEPDRQRAFNRHRLAVDSHQRRPGHADHSRSRRSRSLNRRRWHNARS